MNDKSVNRKVIKNILKDFKKASKLISSVSESTTHLEEDLNLSKFNRKISKTLGDIAVEV